MSTSQYLAGHAMHRLGGGRSGHVAPALAIVTVSLAIAGVAGARVLSAVEAEWIMYQDPRLPAPVVEVRFPDGLAPLWSQALASPEREMRRRAAESIVRAHAKGLTELEVTVAPLLDALRAAADERLVLLTVAQALVALDARQAAPVLCEKLDGQDLDLAEIVETALAQWQYAPIADVWRTRLAGPIGLQRLHVLAIRGLAALKDDASLPRLRDLAADPHTPMPVRWEAAQAVGALQAEGLEETSRALSLDQSPVGRNDRLIAAAMLSSHRSESARTLLAELATDPAPAVQALALGHLLRIDPELIMPLIDPTVSSADVNVRRWGAAALFARPTPPRVELLAHMLNDPDPQLRGSVCDNLVTIAQDETLHSQVIDAGLHELNTGAPRGQEQAILLVVTLDHKPVADRLVELLAADQPRVHTTAAWGLSRLEVPSTLAQILDIFTAETDRRMAGKEARPGMYMQLAHLAQAIGRMKYAPADAQLRRYVPKDFRFAQETRAAAIWALGQLHAEAVDGELANQLVERLNDSTGMQPELPLVRRLAAITLGRMRAESSLEDLRRNARLESVQSAVGIACAWAIHEITGEPIPTVPPLIDWEIDWFLQPYQSPPPPVH